MPKQDGHRRHFLDRRLLYLFSYDVDLDVSREEIGFVPGGLRFNVSCVPNESRIYDVARERSGGGSGADALSGAVLWGGDWALVREDDVAISQVRMTIKTDDGALIDSSYRGLFFLGDGGYRRLISEKEKIGTEEEPFVARVIVTPRYETSATRYRWLMENQCVGFGALQVVRNALRRVSYDIYAME